MIKKLLLFLSIFMLVKASSFGQNNLGDMIIWKDSCVSSPSNPLNTVGVGINYFINNLTGKSIKFYWGDGTSTTVTSLTANQGWAYQSHTYANAGTYTVSTVIDSLSTVLDTETKTVNSFCSVVWGYIYRRNDANCTRNLLTEPTVYAPVQVEVRKSGVPIDTIWSNGSFYQFIPSADLTSVFSLQIINPPTGMSLACPTSGVHNFKFDTLSYSSNWQGFDFGVDCDSPNVNFDLSVTGYGLFRPVSNSYISIYPRNSACLGQSGVVTLNLTPQYSFASSSPAPASVSGNTITWNVSNMTNTSAPNIFVTLSPVGTPTIGSFVTNTLSITPTSGDVNTANNTYIMVDSIRASFDPNEKHVNPVGNIVPSQKLTYTIHFENLGNDTAFNIHVMDTLSSYLDVNSFKLIASSHAVSPSIKATTSGNVLKFDFANIKLPDASNPEKNKGFVTYEINAKSSLAYGNVIENTASIFFDINPAVVTNTTKSRYPNPNNIDDVSNAKPLSVYPNPANNQLFIKDLNQFKQVHVLNTLGQQVMTQNIKAGSEFISISNLADGIYYIKAINENGTYIQKFVKQ